MLSQEKFSSQDKLESLAQKVITSQCVVEHMIEREDNEEYRDASNGQDIEEVFRRRLLNLF